MHSTSAMPPMRSSLLILVSAVVLRVAAEVTERLELAAHAGADLGLAGLELAPAGDARQPLRLVGRRQCLAEMDIAQAPRQRRVVELLGLAGIGGEVEQRGSVAARDQLPV